MKYTTQANGGKANYPSVQRKETEPNVITTEVGGMKVDPSVRLGAIRGEPLGCVPLERTMAKPQAYQAKAGPK